MKIFLLDRNPDIANQWLNFFREPNIEVVCDNFAHFMRDHNVDCVVSPGNSYGLMDGGYDAAITAWFGNQLQERVQRYIVDHFRGEQPVGTSFIIDAGKDDQSLIHTPTMRKPQPIVDYTIIYQCMRTTLLEALKHNIESVVIPAFGAATGRVPLDTVAQMMWLAYRQIQNPPAHLDWHYALSQRI